MTRRAKGFRWHRRAVDDYGVDFNDESFPRLDAGETLVATPSGPAIEITQLVDGAQADKTDEFDLSNVTITGNTVVWRKGAADTDEQDAGQYELLVLVYTDAGRRMASSHPLEVIETGDSSAP